MYDTVTQKPSCRVIQSYLMQHNAIGSKTMQFDDAKE